MTQHRCRISVILPFHNAGETLERAITSIAEQDTGDFECILVDNNSEDSSPDIAGRWTEKDPRFRLCRESRQGVMFASNRGAVLAGGAYVARMDADDRSHPHRLRLQASFLESHPEYGAVGGLVEHVGDPASTAGFKRYVKWSNSIISYKDIYNRRFIEAPIVNPTAMWRKETMERYGMYREGDFPEDYELWLRWLDAGVKIAKLPQVVLAWYDSEARLTRTDERYSDRAFYQVKTGYLARWLERCNPFHPEVVVWGASRISRRRARLLEGYGIRIASYVDTREGRQIERGVIHYTDLPEAGRCFILTYVRQMDNREKIRKFLGEKGYTEGRNYMMVS